MAEQALITGLLALLAFAVFVGVVIEVILDVSEKGIGFLFKRDSKQSESVGENEKLGKVGKHFVKKRFEDFEHVRKERTFRDKGRNALLVGAIAILSLSFSSPAFATDYGYVFYGPVTFTYEGATTYEVGIVAENKYDAAAYMLGYDPNSEQFTPEVKALLSNSDTGTAFYGFAQNFVHPNEAGSVFSPEFWSTANAVYGHEYVWRGTYTQTGKLAAQIALEAILNGGNSGGGSDGGYSIDVTDGLADSYTLYAVGEYVDATIWTDPTKYKQISGEGTLNITNKEAFAAKLNELGCKYIAFVYWPYQIKNGTGSFSAKLHLFASPTPIDIQLNYVEGTPTYINAVITTESTLYKKEDNNWGHFNVDSDGVLSGYIDFTFSNLSFSNNSFTLSGQYRLNYTTWALVTDSSGLNPIPGTNWPEPSEPTPWVEPFVPIPTTPIPPNPVDEPVYLPDPTMPIPTPEDGPTYTTADLSAVLDAMNRHCIHLQSAIYGAASQFWGLLSSKMTNDLSAFTTWLGSWFGTFLSDFDAGIGHLESYLHSLAEWLAEQFDFTFTSSAYDDGSVVAWLKKIWAKLGTGTVNTRPDDPVADPIGIGNWLGTLFDNLISTLMGLGAELLGGISDDLDTLTGKFPFSIPWDIAAILVLFVSDPVTPVLEFPWYTVTTEGLVSTPIVVDCSPYDPYMVVVRTVELAIFGAGLAWRTKDVMDVLSSVGGDG